MDTRWLVLPAVLVLPLGCSTTPERTRVVAGGAPVAGWARSPDEETVVAPVHLLHGFPALNGDGSVNVVVEMPTGTTARFELEADSGQLRWEREEGRPGVVEFLGYPANHGMIPCTMRSPEEGGDGRPQEVLVLGPALERGQLVRTKVIGLLRILDGGTARDQVIAVPVAERYRNNFSPFDDIRDLEARHPGVLRILELWFSGYREPGATQVRGWTGAAEGLATLLRAASAYRREREKSVQGGTDAST